MLNENIDIDISNYEKLCSERSNFHARNSFSAKRWDNFLSITGIILSASASLVVPLMVVYELNIVAIAIASNVFTFLLAVTSSLKNNFNFSLLHHQHSNVSEDFKVLESEFFMLSRKSHSLEELEKLIIKYQGINQRSNIQPVKNCNVFCCCFV